MGLEIHASSFFSLHMTQVEDQRIEKIRGLLDRNRFRRRENRYTENVSFL